MDYKEIEEALELMGYGTGIPTKLKEVVKEFSRMKCSIRPERMSMSDVVTCVMIYELAAGKAKKNG